MQLSRNSLCPCGSGKKYKRCCIERSLETCIAFCNEDDFAEYEDHPTAALFLILIKDLLDAVDTSNSRECIVILGVIAWNTAVCGDQSPDMLKDFARKLNATAECREYADGIIQHLIERKNMLFPRDDHIILDFTFEDRNDKMTLKFKYGNKAA